MTEVGSTFVARAPQTGFLERAAILGACGVAVALFFTVGWIAMAPDDPLGAVSLLSRSSPVAMYVQATALALLAAGGGALIAGRLLPDIGTFAACVGLMTVSFRGATAEGLLIDSAGRLGAGTGIVGIKLFVETAAWIPVCCGSILFSAIILRWHRVPALNQHTPTAGPSIADMRDAGTQFPYLASRWFGADDDDHDIRRLGFMHACVVAAATVILTLVFTGGFGTRASQHGQSCFVVAAAVAIGAYLGHRSFPVRSPFWTLVGFWVASLVCYLWATLRPGMAALPVPLSFHPVLRILPIQFVASGSAGAILMFWNLTSKHDDGPYAPAAGERDERGDDATALPGRATKRKRRKRK